MPMPRRRLLLLIIAGLIALTTILLVRNGLQQPPPQEVATAPAPQIEVLVAKKDLPAGSFVASSDVEWRAWPATVPQDGLLVKTTSSDTDYNGAVVRVGLRAGEPVPQGRLIKAGDRGFLAAVLTPGMRAMTVKITPQSGVAGFIFPNDYVDVILASELDVGSGSGESTQKRHTSQTVLENVRVLGLDQKTDDQNKEVKTAELATLEVTPKQAEKLALVGQFSETQMGRLSLALRSMANDQAVKATENNDTGLDPKLVEAVQQALPAPMPHAKGQRGGVTWDTDVSSALPAPPSENNVEHKVQIYRGSEVSDMTFTGGS